MMHDIASIDRLTSTEDFERALMDSCRELGFDPRSIPEFTSAKLCDGYSIIVRIGDNLLITFKYPTLQQATQRAAKKMRELALSQFFESL